MSSRLVHGIAAVLVLSTVLRPADVRAQQGVIEGRVTDDEGLPLPGAHVVLVGTPYGDAAVDDGTYRVDRLPAGTYDVRATAVGFAAEERQVTLQPGARERVDFALEEVALQSDEVVVTAARREQAARGVAASVSTLTARDLQTRNVVALDDALRYVPGVQMTGNQVNVRGSSGFSYNTGSRVLLLIDGMPMLRPDADGIPFDAVPMHQVERVEVLKGPGSALYGGGALGGTIHVITKTYPDAPETFLEIYGGAYEPVRYEVWRSKWDEADVPRPMAGVTLSHARSFGARLGAWTNVTYRYDAGHLRLGRRRSLQAFTKLTWHPAADARLDVLAGANRRTSDSFLFWNGARDALNPGRIEFGRSDLGTGSADNLINEMSLQPTYTDVLAPNVFMSARARIFGVLIQALDDQGNAKPLSDGTAGFRYGGEIQLNYQPVQGRHLTVGAAGDANAARSGFFSHADRLSQPEGAVFLQWEEALGDRVNLTGGLRYDSYRIRQDRVERKLSPRASASLILNPRWTLRLAYGQGFRVPSVAERYIDNSDHLPVVANLDLKPETSRSFEAGVRVHPGVSLRALDVELDGAAFWSDYRDLVEPTFVPSEYAFQFVNLTHARVRGFELTVDAKTVADRVGIAAGYTYLDADDLTLDEPLVSRSRHLFKAGLSTRLGPLDVAADLRLASEPERVDSDFARFIRDAEMAGPTQVLDLRVGSSWGAFRGWVHVKNALDYYYLERPALLAPPRHVILQLSATF